MVEMDVIVAGRDLVAVDSVCGFTAGFQPQEVPITAEAAARGLGLASRDEIEVLGESIESVSRRFVRTAEDERLKFEGLRLLHGGETCSGCRNGIMSSIFDMSEIDRAKHLPQVVLVTGNPDIPENVSPERIITVGRCVAKENRSSRHVQGCPPNNVFIREAIGEGQ
jgi:hypothetical protein